MRDHDDSRMLSGRQRSGDRFADDHRSRDRNEERSAFFGNGSSSADYGGDRFESRDRGRARDRFEGGRSSSSRGDPFDRDEEFGSDAYHKGIPMDETRRLIASSKVEGTPVYGRDGDRLGSIHNFMVDKMKGEVVYAVLRSSSGFLGFGERYHPLDWDELTYDKRLDGYHVDLTEDELDDRRSFDMNGRENSRRDRGRNYDRR